MAELESVKVGPNGKPVRPFVMPDSLTGKLKVWRFLLMRRFTQVATLLLFFGSAHWAWSVNDKPLISGNLSASMLLDSIPLSDPFAVLQIIFAQQSLLSEVIMGALIVLAFYLIVGGRVWCSWVCPVNMITDLSAFLRRRLDVKNALQLRRKFRYTMLVLTLVLSALTGVAAFEWISPIGIFHREIIFGLGTGWLILAGIFIFDLFILRDGWCGYICPLGAFYSLVGKFSVLRIRFNTPTCTHCVECTRICPEPQVLDLRQASQKGYISAGECTNCGRCISVCPEDTLHFDIKFLIAKHNAQDLSNSIDVKNSETDHRRQAA